jgi:hypothetical protein
VVEIAIAKMLLAPTATFFGRKLMNKVLPAADVKELQRLCAVQLYKALEEALEPFPNAPEEHRLNLYDRLATVLNDATLKFTGVENASAPALVAAAEANESADWSTFGLPDESGDLRVLDFRPILERFMTDLRPALQVEVRRAKSPLKHLADSLNFATLEDGVDELRGTLASLLPFGTTSDLDEAWSRAGNGAQVLLAERRVRSGTRMWVPTTQESEWVAWTREPGWRVSVLDGLRKLVDGVSDAAPDLSDDVEHMVDKVSRPGQTFSQMCAAVDVDLLRKVERRVNKLQNDPQSPRGLGGVGYAARWLRKQVDSPSFKNCFAITGTFGSGTSHFLTSVLEKAEAAGDIAVFVAPTPGQTFGAAACAAIGYAFGRDVRSLGDVAALTSGDYAHKAIYLCVEDVDRYIGDSLRLDELMEAIDVSTATSGLRWCLTANLDSYYRVIGRSGNLWLRYSVATDDDAVADGTAIGGWRNLDTLNAKHSLGLRILEQLAAEDHADIETIRANLAEFKGEQSAFANPLPALLRHRSLEQGKSDRPLTDPQDPAFIDLYWDYLLDQRNLAEQPADAGHSEYVTSQTVGVITDRLLAQPPAPSEAFVPNVTLFPAPEATGEVDLDATARLRWMGLLRDQLIGPGQVRDRSVVNADLGFLPFWGMRVGERLLEEYEAGDEQKRPALLVWRDRAVAVDEVAKSACQFALGIAAEQATPKSKDLWRTWHHGEESPRVAFLLAAAAAPAEYNAFATSWVGSRGYRPETRREMFLFLRLVGSARNPEWGADTRLRALAPHWSRIGVLGLTPYAQHVVQRILRTPGLLTGDNYIETCRALLGCEDAGVADVAARVTVQRGIRVFGLKQMPKVAVAVFTAVSESPTRTRGQRPGDRRRDDYRPELGTKGCFPHLFSEHLLEYLFSQDKPSEVLRDMADVGWWTIGRPKQRGGEQSIHRLLAILIEIGAAVKFGYTAHENGPDDDYVAVVDDIINGDLLYENSEPRRLTVALYLIKHSSRTYSSWNLDIAEQLHNSLRAIDAKRGLPGSEVGHLRELLHANGLASGQRRDRPRRR